MGIDYPNEQLSRSIAIHVFVLRNCDERESLSYDSQPPPTVCRKNSFKIPTGYVYVYLNTTRNNILTNIINLSRFL